VHVGDDSNLERVRFDAIRCDKMTQESDRGGAKVALFCSESKSMVPKSFEDKAKGRNVLLEGVRVYQAVVDVGKYYVPLQPTENFVNEP
jgi:hypothetical protein